MPGQKASPLWEGWKIHFRFAIRYEGLVHVIERGYTGKHLTLKVFKGCAAAG